MLQTNAVYFTRDDAVFLLAMPTIAIVAISEQRTPPCSPGDDRW